MKAIMKKLALPVTCLNGTCQQDLIDEIMECRDGLEKALTVMRNVEFTNQRNFQLSNQETYKLCLLQHLERIAKVEEVSRELLTMAFEIQDLN